jgi:hypothetical protein
MADGVAREGAGETAQGCRRDRSRAAIVVAVWAPHLCLLYGRMGCDSRVPSIKQGTQWVREDFPLFSLSEILQQKQVAGGLGRSQSPLIRIDPIQLFLKSREKARVEKQKVRGEFQNAPAVHVGGGP